MRRFFTPRIPLGNTSLVIPAAPLNVAITGPNIFVINPTQGATKFHPGNGGWGDNQYWNQAEGTWYTQRNAEFKADATLKHLEIVLTWAQLEVTQGDYSNGFAIIDGILANLRTAATPTYLTIKWWHAQFNTTSTTDASAWPAYVIAKGNWIKGFTSSSGVTRNQLDFDNDQIWAVLTTMFKAYGDKYDAEPLFEMIGIMDESDAVTVINTGATILNGTHYNAKYKQLFLDVKAHWPTTLVWSTLNFLPPGGTEALNAMQDIIVSFRAAYPGGFCFGGPDPAIQGVHGGGPTNWITTFQNLVAGQTGTLGDIRGQIVLVSHIEEYLLGNTGSPPTAPPVTPTQLMNSAVDIYKAQYVFWNYQNWEFYKWADQLAAIHARNGITNSAPSEGNFSGGIAAPADFYVTLQGQTAQNSSTFRTTGGDPSYNMPNEGSIYLGWPDAVAGSFPVAHYEVQHSTDGGVNWTVPTGGASISTAAADSQGTRFKDLNCPNSVGSTYGPTSGQYLAATVYLHRLRAVDTHGTVSAWVTGANQYFFNGLAGGKSVVSPSGSNTGSGGGLKWGGDLSSGYPTNYAVADATYGFVATIDMSAAGGGYFLPTTGCNYCTYNQQVGAADYFYVLLKTTNPNINILMHGEVVGDLKMQPGGAPAANLSGGELKLASYVQGGTVQANTYQLYQIPLAHFMTPQAGFAGSASAIGVKQKGFYKFLWQAQASGIITLAKGWFGK